MDPAAESQNYCTIGGVTVNGTIISFDQQSGLGLIRGSDSQRYNFSDQEWLAPNLRPVVGHTVDFETSGTEALQIAVLHASTPPPLGGSALSEGTSNGTVLGGVSILFGVFALTPAFGVLMAIIGVVTGFIGRKQAKASNNSTGKLLCIIGLSISIAILALQLIIGLLWSGLLFGLSSTSGSLW